jgi:hypothetical protein
MYKYGCIKLPRVVAIYYLLSSLHTRSKHIISYLILLRYLETNMNIDDPTVYGICTVTTMIKTWSDL